MGSQMVVWGHWRGPVWPHGDGGCLVQMQSLCSLPIVRYQEPQEEDGLEDMTQLE